MAVGAQAIGVVGRLLMVARRDPGDRRGRRNHAANESRLLGPLDEDELRALDRCLRKLLAALDGA